MYTYFKKHKYFFVWKQEFADNISIYLTNQHNKSKQKLITKILKTLNANEV